MKASRWIALGAAAAAATAIGVAYRRDLAAARKRVAAGSHIAETSSGPIEYAVRGEGPPLLIVHGAGGGFDQGLMLGESLHGFRIIAPSRFGYLKTPLPRDSSAEAQADAHAALLDTLQVERAFVIGVSAGGPSAMQLSLRHPERCAALVLLVPLAWADRPPPPRMSRTQSFLMDRALKSDFAFWAAMRSFRRTMLESILGTPFEDIERASPADQERVHAVMDSILPVSRRAAGLMNDRAVAQSLRRYELEHIDVPTLVAGVENCGSKTYEPARYTALHIAGARFISYPRGGHLWLGHEAELSAEVARFLAGINSLPTRSACV
jgi:2-hydroxy-6-oxonona-2,4-dienedioate hydrolase